MSDLEQLAQQVRSCTDCPLHCNRVHAVPGEGSETAEVFFIGEGPGHYEDQQGRPFVGPAGQFLNQLLTSIGLRREDVYITNMVKCRPPSNRDPFPGEIAACSKYLDEQIRLIRPKVIVTLGRHSLTKFLPKETISKARGRPRKTPDGTIIYPMYHPAAALHQQSLRHTIEEDFKGIAALLKAQLTPEQTDEDVSQQLSMF